MAHRPRRSMNSRSATDGALWGTDEHRSSQAQPMRIEQRGHCFTLPCVKIVYPSQAIKHPSETVHIAGSPAPINPNATHRMMSVSEMPTFVRLFV
jgi:hypothetical protein